MRRKIAVGLALGIAFCAIPMFVVYAFGYIPFLLEPHNPSAPGETSGWSKMGLFSMDTETILSSLDQAETNLFIPESIGSSLDAADVMYSRPILISESIPWSQADYLDVVNALNRVVWHDSLDNWNLHSMHFFTTCQDNVSGFRNGDFVYIKTKFDWGRLSVLWRGVFLYPDQEGGLWAEAEKFHPTYIRKGIDLDRLVVTADDALRIAEENGGREYRTKIQNDCTINVTLSADRWYGWFVWIGDFEIYIDPYTGEIHD